MIVPTAADVLHTIGVTFDTVIRPSLTGLPERSAAATISHLLRHAELRVEQEGQILFDTIAALRTLLPQLHDYFVQLGQTEPAAALATALATPPRPQGEYPSLTKVGAEANILTTALEVALQQLQSLRPTQGDTHAYTTLRTAIRTYLADQVRSEATLIHPAYAGHGPRR